MVNVLQSWGPFGPHFRRWRVNRWICFNETKTWTLKLSFYSVVTAEIPTKLLWYTLPRGRRTRSAFCRTKSGVHCSKSLCLVWDGRSVYHHHHNLCWHKNGIFYYNFSHKRLVNPMICVNLLSWNRALVTRVHLTTHNQLQFFRPFHHWSNFIPNTAVFGPTNFIGTTTTIASTTRMRMKKFMRMKKKEDF